MKGVRTDVAAYILADHRESNGAIPYLQAAVDENNTASTKLAWKIGGGNLMYEVLNNGAVGDYTIMIPSKYNDAKNIVAAVFERKTWKDLAASIKDQRSISQHKALQDFRAKHGCLIYYIIEGNLVYADDTQIQHIPFKNLSAKMRSMSIKGVHSFQTKDQQHTARFLSNFARDLSRLYRQGAISFPVQEGVASKAVLLQELQTSLKNYTTPSSDPLIIDALKNLISLVEANNKAEEAEKDGEFDTYIPSSSSPTEMKETKGGEEKKEEKKDIIHIPESLKQKSKKSHTDVLMNMWCAIPKVSTKSAPILMEKVDIKDLICCKSANRTALRDLIANLRFAGGTRIGDAKANEIMQCAIYGLDSATTFIARDIHVKILAQVPKISHDTAVLILAVVELTRICEAVQSKNEFIIEDVQNAIAAVVRPTGKKIGDAAAKMIIEVFSSEPDLSSISVD